MPILSGQRWASEPEPELGLGRITEVRNGRIAVSFPAAEERRVYAWPGAPLVRVIFAAGDHLEGPGGSGMVEAAREEEGLISYRIGGQWVAESDLSGRMARRGAWDRLAAGDVDSTADFEIRREALFRRAQWQRSPVRGFQGARMELIAHQLGIVAEVAGRLLPRVLLADEVGLGKTIEACLILHRLHLTGRAARVLVLVPGPLVHQWFVEMLRRFHMRFSIFDEERCEAIENGPEGETANPFQDSQLVLCGLNLVTGDRRRADQVVAAGWDLLIVDEAHRLLEPGAESATRDQADPLETVTRLALVVPGILLLSGTPQQAGWRTEFELLRLVDPARYNDSAAFQSECAAHGDLAQTVALLDAGEPPNWHKLPAEVRDWPETEALSKGSREASTGLRKALLDRCGLGRVMFRNVRSALGGFPGRRLRAAPLPDDSVKTRTLWLAGWLRTIPCEKVLLICRRRETVEAVREALQEELQIKAGVFHEGLTLLQRDRQAAWFSEEDGAAVLLCSEIGGEGRNFQFARHLVLWDLPADPDVLEQRIGRLDRIGRRGTIEIHVPYAAGTSEEILFRWLRDGLGMFLEPVSGAARMAEATNNELRRTMENPTPENISGLLEKTRGVRELIRQEQEEGYDRLLRWQAGTGAAADLEKRLRDADEDPQWEKFTIRLLESLGMQVEELRQHEWRFQAGSPESESLPELPVEGLTAIFDRSKSLIREDAAFLTPDHPLVQGALESLLGSPRGSVACGIVEGQGTPGLLLEACWLLECVAAPALQADRFLPSLPVRVVIDQKGIDRSDDHHPLKWKIADADRATLPAAWEAVKHFDLPAKAAAAAEARKASGIAAALKRMHRLFDADITRLEILSRRHRHPTRGEVLALRDQRDALHLAISNARLRVDAVRVLILRP